MTTRFINTSIVTPTAVVKSDLLVDATTGRVISILERTARLSPFDAPVQVVDLGGRTIFPGLVDILTHGFGNHLYADGEPGCIVSTALFCPKFGITSFVPSLTCREEGNLLQLLGELGRQTRASVGRGARCIGLHSEGPCFADPGCHNPLWMQKPSVRLAEAMVKAAGGSLALVTLAPELEGAEEFVRLLIKEGVRVHLGHTKAAAEAIPTYADWGIDGVTHIYGTFHPGTVIIPGLYPLSLADACLAESRLCLGVICDEVHVLPTQLRLLSHLPLNRVFLESDSMKLTGCPAGEFELYPGKVIRTSDNSPARGVGGELAGSSITCDRALRNWVKHTNCDLPRASWVTSLNPARLAGREHDLGSIEPGKFADFIVLDESLNVLATYVGGVKVFNQNEKK